MTLTRCQGACGASVESADGWLAMTSSKTEEAVPRLRPKWWFGILWVGAFVLPIALQGTALSLWQGSGTAVEIGMTGATVFVLVSAVGTGVLIRHYVPRPLFWTMGPIACWGLLYLLGIEWRWFVLAWLTGLPGILLGVLAVACLAGAIQSRAFINAGDDWSRSRRARLWIGFSALTWLAMLLAPFATQGFSNDLMRPFDMNLETWLVVASAGGAVSCAGILRILHVDNVDANDGAEHGPP